MEDDLPEGLVGGVAAAVVFRVVGSVAGRVGGLVAELAGLDLAVGVAPPRGEERPVVGASGHVEVVAVHPEEVRLGQVHLDMAMSRRRLQGVADAMVAAEAGPSHRMPAVEREVE